MHEPHIEPGTIFYRVKRTRQGKRHIPYFRVVGCTCGRDGGRTDHTKLREAERCGQRVRAA